MSVSAEKLNEIRLLVWSGRVLLDDERVLGKSGSMSRRDGVSPAHAVASSAAILIQEAVARAAASELEADQRSAKTGPVIRIVCTRSEML